MKITRNILISINYKTAAPAVQQQQQQQKQRQQQQ
jgi:hypothetical protein